MNVIPKNLGMLGDGVTATAVREVAEALGIPMVPHENAEWVVASPGIPPRQYPEVRGEIISDIELADRLIQARGPRPIVVGVTGTNGKSTVVSLISHILGVPSFGNIGLPLIRVLLEPALPKVLVVELSSYQLERCILFRPDIAVLLNITPDHLERHQTMDLYVAAKMRLFQAQTPKDLLIYDDDCDRTRAAVTGAIASTVAVSTRHLDRYPLFPSPPFIGTHNLSNAAFAFEVVSRLGVSTEDCLAAMATYERLAHRIEWVANVNGVTYFNDSKATNPESTEVAVATMRGPVRLILGGKDKGLDWDGFLGFLRGRVVDLVLYGDIGPRALADANRLFPDWKVNCVTTLQEALDLLVTRAHPGDTILFSPACSSFDQFKNFEDRGDTFKRLVLL